jgi:hypothetical protein
MPGRLVNLPVRLGLPGRPFPAIRDNHETAYCLRLAFAIAAVPAATTPPEAEAEASPMTHHGPQRLPAAQPARPELSAFDRLQRFRPAFYGMATAKERAIAGNPSS